jgi:hypothetical protein
VDLSGIIFVVLAVAWAVYLVPKALKHHDEVARTRSVERFSTAMRVLARREPVDRRSARLVVTPARPGERVIVPARPAPSAATRWAASRAAARRRRHVTVVLLGVSVVVTALAVLAVAPWWSVAVPVLLTVGYLALCRRQVRHKYDAEWSPAHVEHPAGRPDAREGTVVPRRAIRVEAPYGALQAPRETAGREGSSGGGEFSPDEDTVQIAMAELQTVAVSVETVDGGSLWDPLPVTLPTYVGKARAARTVSTIDLSAPDSWSSGRDEADSALVERTVAAEPTESTGSVDGGGEPQRAVGS